MSEEKIQRIGCSIKDPKLKHALEDISGISSLARPVVCLPDIHMKEHTEAPCSFVAATDDTIVPELTAPSVGCGMGMVATSLKCEDITPEKLDMFYKEMQKYRGHSYGTAKNILLWLGLIHRPRNKYDLSKEELANVVRDGAKTAVQKYNLPEETLSNIEYNGDAVSTFTEYMFPLSSVLPRAAWVSGRHDIGYGFKGNHFLEIQYIEKIEDEETARVWDLSEGQVIIMYHGGGGAVSHYLGRYFARRKKDTGRFHSRLFQFFAKLLFHFTSWEGIRHARERWRYYFGPRPFQEIPASTLEGRRLLASIAASLNYSYAFRIAIVKRVHDALAATFGASVSDNSKLLWDNIHNSIRKEYIGGKEYIVHRHTATRVFEGKPVLISGFNNTNSYIGVGLPGAEEYLFSADHGAGETIKRHATTETSRPYDADHTTTIYKTKSPYTTTEKHRTSGGLEAVTKPLEEFGIVRRVALTRPMAVFKG